ncbi:unnamed protein product [Rhizophagus irregularis]|uniref:Uncharacterized protein n=1 Tax=Rhizophagus irregularis TaxID=588596 RepID=A0A915YYK2_9GLOM|nr:unnamed protein product [Rhizophagus irregularis]
METNEEKHEFIVEFSRNISQLDIDNERDNINDNNIKEIEKIEEIEEENIRVVINLSREYQFNLPTHYSIFSLVFSLEQIKTIVKTTNTYACIKNGGEKRSYVRSKSYL